MRIGKIQGFASSCAVLNHTAKALPFNGRRHSKAAQLAKRRIDVHQIDIGVALLLTGCMLFVSDRMTPGKKTERNMRFRDALIIGLCQCVATIPGLSRSGTTITAGIATGLDRKFAMKYSFLLSLPAVLGANLLSIIKALTEESIDASLIPAYLIGMLFAMLSGIAALLLMKLIARKSKFGWFAYYCWGAGALTIILSLIF